MALRAIGVDSGGTRTTCAYTRGQDSEMIVKESSRTLSDARGERSLRSTAEWIVERVLDASEPDDETCVWIGASAHVSAASCEALDEAFELPLRQLERENRDCEILIANDAVSLCKSPPLHGRGVVAIVGTGSIVLGSHPRCPDNVVRRGGYEWPTGDVGAGVWMTFESLKLVIEDIHTQGSVGYHSPLLDRLCDFFGVDSEAAAKVPSSHAALARAELVANVLAQSHGEDGKRHVANFVYPNLFDLAQSTVGRPHDPIAARVIASSVRRIADDIGHVSSTLSAFTGDHPNTRERVPVIAAGSIANNPIYRQQLTAAVSECAYVGPLVVTGDSAHTFAELAMHYLRSDAREKKAILRQLDAVHQVHRLI